MESNSCSSCKSSESSTLREIGVIRAITNPVNSNESFPPVNNERMLGSSWQCRDIESNRILLPKCQSLGDDRKTEKEPGQSELSETYVVSSINVDASRKDRSIQRCRRSNGKQKPCARSATTGTIFCDLHHNLKSRPCGKTDASSGKAYFVKQERAEVSNENHEIPERCRRSDGKFWQCSKQAMPGFVYCENHRNRQKKSKKQPKSADSRATKDTLAAECHATTVKVEKDMDDSSFCSPSRNSGLMHLCNLIAKERELDMTVFSDSCEINIQANGRGTFNAHSECEGRNSRNAFQIGTTEVVDRFTHANREVSPKTVEYGLSSRTRSDSEVKVSVDDFGQCTLADVRKEGSTALKVNRLDSLFPASGFTPSGLGSSENDNVGFAQILQKKGMPLGCSQVSRSGSPHYEYRQLKLYYGNERHGTGQKLIVPRETDTHHEGTGDRGTDCTGEGCVGVESLDEESHGLDGLSNSIPLEILSLRQCRRKDVKGCECSNNVKDGQSNCLHHLESLSKRKTHYQCENEGRSSGICMLEEDSAIIPVTENQGPGDSKSMQKRSFDGMHSGIPNIVNVDCEYGNGPFNEPMEAASQHTSFANFMEYSRCGHLAGVFRAATDIKEFAAGHETCRKQELCASGSYQPNETSPKVISQHGKDIISGESSKQQRSMIATDCLGKSDNNTCVAQNPPLATISIGPSLQCQRKDGKGWRCSKNAEDGLKYCLHHLASLKSKRLNSKKRRKDCQQSEGQDSKVILRDTGQACPCPSSVM
ncbi:hypothetical protein KP509_37G026200 [Ceratopteris richardii]|nr:hypothetical protein KP509_37G026200 [Ceratopteris richardii]